MKIIEQDGQFSATFDTTKGVEGRVALPVACLDDAIGMATEMKIDELERASKLVNLSHEVVTQIVTGRSVTVLDGIALWKEAVVSGRVLAPTTVTTNECLTRQWAREMDVEKLPISAVTPKHVSDFINRGAERRTTALRKLAAIRQLFCFLRDSGYCSRNPAAPSLVRVTHDTFRHEELERTSKKLFTKDETQSLLHTAVPTFWPIAIRLALTTGLRLGDIATLEWDSISDTGHLAVWTDKSDTRVFHKLDDQLRRDFQSLASSGASEPHCFPEQCAMVRESRAGRSVLSMQFIRLCTKCGISGKSFHNLRHTYASQLARDGATVGHVAGQLGHRDTAVTQLYIHA
jgi:integrase